MAIFLILILLILCLLILAGLIYALITTFSLIVNKILNKKEFGSFRKNKKYKTVTISISVCVSILLSCTYLFYNPAKNLKTAYIEKSAGKYIITLYGKRNLMVHDPISLLRKETYIDSTKFEIPRSEGGIDGLEILNKPGSYKLIKGDAITINSKTLKVQLFYDSYDTKTIKASNWNGGYELKWRN